MVAIQQLSSSSNWEGLLKWWNLPHSDGTHRRPPASNFSEEDGVDDPAERVYQISGFLHVWKNTKYEDEDEDEDEVVTSADLEAVLDELLGYVESIDVAEELHSVQSLVPLFYNVMYNQHAGVRAKAAELVTSMLQHNLRGQEFVMKADGIQPLLYNISDPDVTARTKALGAISALIRNNKPGINAFRLDDGYTKLRDALSTESVTFPLSTESVMFQREALNLIQYLLHENSSDCNIVTELGFPGIMMHLTSSDDAEVREAALKCLLVLARDEGGNSGQLVRNDDKLKQVLQELIKRISAMAPEDLVAAREEIQLVDSLWNACYNEPSSLKLFEPSPRALAAADPKL